MWALGQEGRAMPQEVIVPMVDQELPYVEEKLRHIAFRSIPKGCAPTPQSPESGYIKQNRQRKRDSQIPRGADK